MERKRIIGFYDYTVILTYIGMLSAFIGILCSINEKYLMGIIFLMVAGICDMFDGTVANTKNRTSSAKHFGIEIDSMSDLISFGIFPAVFVYVFLGKNVETMIISSIYVLCALIRLSYFDVQEYERQKEEVSCRKKFLGVPVTTVAICLPLLFLLYVKLPEFNKKFFSAGLLMLSAGFLLKIEIKKPRIIGKIVIMLVGIAEAVGLFCILGVDLI